MAEIGKAYVQIIPTAEGISGKVSKLLGDEGKKGGDEGGKGFANGIKSALMKIGIGAFLVKSVKDSLEAGGALQQSFGGLETLYGEASEQAKQFAMTASQAGISANDYAEQAVSFGASLKQAFGGDTTKAVEAANTAIMDMADNSAKMGTDIGLIQSAYQGFAKQNYTMLDNLKLGYGGTKTEMERLLKDATKLTGVKYDISNLGDVYEAIHVIQQDLGLTGVAAQEASETFTGSLGAMKASLTNVLAGLSLGQDITAPLLQLEQAVRNFLLKNLLPMVGNILKSLPTVLSGALGSAIGLLNSANVDMSGLLQFGLDLIAGLADSLVGGLPSLIEAGWNLMSSFVNALKTFDWMTWLGEVVSMISDTFSVSMSEVGATNLLSTATTFISNLIAGFMQNAPQLASSALQIMGQFLSGIGQALPGIIAKGAEVVSQLIATFAMNLPQFLQKGIEIIGELISGIIRAIPNVLRAIPQVVSSIKGAFERFDWKTIGANILNGIGTGIANAVTGLVNTAIQACKSLTDSVKSFFGIASPSKLMAKEVGRWLPPGIADGILNNLSPVRRAMEEMESEMLLDNPSMTVRATAVGATSLTSSEAIPFGGFQQNVTINSPRELSPSEVARQTRNATQQMVLSMSGV